LKDPTVHTCQAWRMCDKVKFVGVRREKTSLLTLAWYMRRDRWELVQ
jgi:hypothetical protein